MTRHHLTRMHPVERYRLIEARGRTCQYCGVEGDRWQARGQYWQIDHILPVQYGGSVFDDDNLALSCYRCNFVKSDALLDALADRLAAVCAGTHPSKAADHAPIMLAYREQWPQTQAA